ncbi:MAG: hypothetical protein RR744_10135 [Cellulosilyticaceae bacterium]
MGFAEKEQSRTKRKSPVSTIAGIETDEQIKGQESIETLEDGKYMPTPTEEPKKEKKKAGRPKVNRELKKRYSFTILPSLYEQSSEIASNEGKSLSELITDFLTEYVEKNS